MYIRRPSYLSREGIDPTIYLGIDPSNPIVSLSFLVSVHFSSRQSSGGTAGHDLGQEPLFPLVFPSLSLFPYLDDSSTLAAPILSTAGQRNTELGEHVVVCTRCRGLAQRHVTEIVPRSASGRRRPISIQIFKFELFDACRHAGTIGEGRR
jgi:hypothetical protein